MDGLGGSSTCAAAAAAAASSRSRADHRARASHDGQSALLSLALCGYRARTHTHRQVLWARKYSANARQTSGLRARHVNYRRTRPTMTTECSAVAALQLYCLTISGGGGGVRAGSGRSSLIALVACARARALIAATPQSCFMGCHCCRMGLVRSCARARVDCHLPNGK